MAGGLDSGCAEIGQGAAFGELEKLVGRFCRMSEGAEKLRQLAKQSRLLSRQSADRHRSMMLRGLALLYEEQAVQAEQLAADQLG